MILFHAGILSVVLTASAAAQPYLEPVSMPFTERLTDRVPVKGHALVGLLSTLSAELPDGVGLTPGSMALPGSLAGTDAPVCVRATTQDGRYSAENNFAVQPGLQSSGRVDFDWPTAYPAALHAFPLREVAALARRGSCADKAEILPVMLGAGAALGTLQVLVNTHGGAVTAALRDAEAGRTLMRANCTRVTGTSRVAFDARCVLGPASEFPAHVQLRLEQVSRDGLQTEVLDNVTLRLAE